MELFSIRIRRTFQLVSTVDNVAASHKDYEMMIASLDRSIAEMKKR